MLVFSLIKIIIIQKKYCITSNIPQWNVYNFSVLFDIYTIQSFQIIEGGSVISTEILVDISMQFIPF